MKKIWTNCGGNYEPIWTNRRRKDWWTSYAYVWRYYTNDDRINLLFNDGFDKIKIEQKRFFRLFLGQPGHSIFATPDLRKKHMKLPISIKEAKYWLEDFELALDRIDIDPAIKKFFSQKINSLTMQMINTI